MLDLPFGGWIVGFLDYSILGLLDLPFGGWIVGFLDYSILGLLGLPSGGWIVGFLDYSILGLLDLPSGGWIVRLLDFWIFAYYFYFSLFTSLFITELDYLNATPKTAPSRFLLIKFSLRLYYFDILYFSLKQEIGGYQLQ
ncbi:MAG: hypothetical protein ACI9OS_001873 [Ulvibacter sp.]